MFGIGLGGKGLKGGKGLEGLIPPPFQGGVGGGYGQGE